MGPVGLGKVGVVTSGWEWSWSNDQQLIYVVSIHRGGDTIVDSSSLFKLRPSWRLSRIEIFSVRSVFCDCASGRSGFTIHGRKFIYSLVLHSSLPNHVTLVKISYSDTKTLFPKLDCYPYSQLTQEY